MPTEAELQHQARIMAMMDPGYGIGDPITTEEGERPATAPPPHQLESAVAAFRAAAADMQGMQPPPPEEAPPTYADDEEFSEEAVKKDSAQWSTTPTYVDQYDKYPSSCRMSSVQMEVFDVTDAKQLKALNTLMAGQEPRSAPSIMMVNKKENFFEGKWLVLIEYCRVEYKKLIKTK
jgi:hypothetical protein